MTELLGVHSVLEQLCRDRGRGLLDAEQLRNLRRANEEIAGAVAKPTRAEGVKVSGCILLHPPKDRAAEERWGNVRGKTRGSLVAGERLMTES